MRTVRRVDVLGPSQSELFAPFPSALRRRCVCFCNESGDMTHTHLELGRGFFDSPKRHAACTQRSTGCSSRAVYFSTVLRAQSTRLAICSRLASCVVFLRSSNGVNPAAPLYSQPDWPSGTVWYALKLLFQQWRVLLSSTPNLLIQLKALISCHGSKPATSRSCAWFTRNPFWLHQRGKSSSSLATPNSGWIGFTGGSHGGRNRRAYREGLCRGSGGCLSLLILVFWHVM